MDEIKEDIPVTPSCTDECCKKIEPVNITTHDSIYWNYLNVLEKRIHAFICEARAGELNKSAALRARKLSVNLRKSLKEWREISAAHDKTHGRKNKTEVELNKEIEALNT